MLKAFTTISVCFIKSVLLIYNNFNLSINGTENVIDYPFNHPLLILYFCYIYCYYFILYLLIKCFDFNLTEMSLNHVEYQKMHVSSLHNFGLSVK